MLEALCRSSGTTLDIRMSRDGPPITQRTSGLKDLGNAAPDIRSCGASLVAIAHQTVPGSNGKFQPEHGLEFPILDDPQGDVAVAYRIRWSPQELAAAEERLGKLPGLATETTWILPMQARYVIG